jgi:hypothetical protein
MEYVISSTNEVNFTRTYETAAWYSQLTAVPGAYTLVRSKDYYGRTQYVAQLSAEVVEDNFQSLLAGSPIGKTYDRTQNAGKSDNFAKAFYPSQLLTDARFSYSEEEYDAVLAEALEELKWRIDLSLSCISYNQKEGRYKWIAGHSAQLAKDSALYSEVSDVMARREYNRKQTDGTGWPKEDITVTVRRA